MPTISLKKDAPWWNWIVIIDVVLVIITIVHAYLVPYPGDSLNTFNLAGEMNFAAWWSSMLLLTLGMLAYELYCTKTDGSNTAWLILAWIWCGLSWDEIGSLHERVAITMGWIAFAPFILVGGSAALYAFLLLYRKPTTRTASILIFVGIVVMSSAIVYEFFERIIEWPVWFIGLRVGAEEGTELLGMFLSLWGVLSQRHHARWPNPISKVIPNPHLMHKLAFILPTGLLLHIVTSIIEDRFVPEMGGRGNPAVWYPVILFSILFYAALWKSWSPRENRGSSWRALAIYFVLSSIAITTMYDIQSKARLQDVLGPLSNFYGQFLVQLLIVFIICFWIYGTLSMNSAFAMAVVGLLIFSGFWFPAHVLQYLVAGVFALLVTKLFLLDNRPKPNSELAA
ncbi:MAG: hypothetical protein R3A44_26225 [Caldilineaceae bacterium]